MHINYGWYTTGICKTITLLLMLTLLGGEGAGLRTAHIHVHSSNCFHRLKYYSYPITALKFITALHALNCAASIANSSIGMDFVLRMHGWYNRVYRVIYNSKTINFEIYEVL
jgi:hypothetical protein